MTPPDRFVDYTDGWRFQTAREHRFATPVTGLAAESDWGRLTPDGMVTIARGYAWDGASGPIPQGPDVIRGSLIHDFAYQLLRNGALPPLPGTRAAFDLLLRQHLREDGMDPAMTALVFHAVRVFGGRFADPKSRKPVLTAPVFTRSSTADWIAP